MAENIPLEQRAGRNIGIESLPVFIQAAAGPEVAVTSIGSSEPGGAAVTLMTAVKNAVRTPFTRGPANGMVFNKDASNTALYLVWLDDGEGNLFLIDSGSVGGGDVEPLDLSGAGPGDPNAFTPAKPLCLCGNEKLIMRAFISED
jgi:hypothetical protein